MKTMHCILRMIGLLCFSAGLLHAQEAPPQGGEDVPKKAAKQAKSSPKVAAPVAKMDGYDVKTSPANIAPTVAIRTDSVEVFGQPRMTKGHPNTYWDQEDINHYKEMMKTSKELQIRLAEIKEAMDKRIAEPIAIPPPQKGPDGKWLFPGDYYPPLALAGGKTNDDPRSRFKHHFSRDSEDVSNLGTLYALTGEAKYAEYARKLLLAYAVCTKWGSSPLYKLRSALGMYGQLLEEAQIMMHWARGYDLVYNLPSWTKEDRIQMHDEFFYPMALSCLYPIAPDRAEEPYFAAQHNNRGLFGAVSVLLAGYVTEDQELINAALYGIHPTITKGDQDKGDQFPPGKPWVAATEKNPAFGLLTGFFAPDCIPGGMWIEPSVGYSFYSLGSMVGAAETLWHHGIDLYRHNNAIFKNMFDFPILLSYPDLSEPGLGASHRELLINYNNAPAVYEYAYRRYRDPRYLSIINNADERQFLATFDTNKMKYSKGLRTIELASIGTAPPSVLFDLDPKEGTTLAPQPSVNWPLVGIGVLRTPSSNGKGLPQNLTFTAGPAGSKAQPDKLQIDLFAFNDVLMPSPGVVFPYDNPLIPKWYGTTLAHNTLTVDEKVQDSRESSYTSKARADQVIFAPASNLGLQRAWSDSVYPSVTLDRAIFMTTDYFADIFGAFSKTPHKYDLAWHIRGDVSSTLKLSPMKFPEPVANGYCILTNVRAAAVSGTPWSMTFTRKEHQARLHTASAPATQVIVADGGLFYDKLVESKKSTAPTILQRRDQTASTVYGNALDYSNTKEGFVKGVTQEGGLDAGFELLKVQTIKGTDLCFAAYRPGNYKIGGLETDSQQAFVQVDGAKVQAMVLCGGRKLQMGNGFIGRSEPGLAYVERLQNGSYILGNPSPTDATVTVTLPALAGMKAFRLNVAGQRGETAGIVKPDGSFSINLQAVTKVELVLNP